jgi:hypothetical protein
MKKGERDRHEVTFIACHYLDAHLEGSSLVKGSKKLSEELVWCNAYLTNVRCHRDSLHSLFSEG